MPSTLARLHDAILSGDADCVAALLRTCGDNVNAIYHQHTALTRALEAGSDDVIIQQLLAHEHFDPNAKNQFCRTALFEASLAGRSEVVESLLRIGVHVDDADRRGVTPLSACAYYNSHHAARVLLAAGADIRSQDCSGDAVLHRACAHGSEEMVTLLLANGQCDVMCRNNNLETPLMLALPSAYNVQVKGQKLSTALSISRRLLLAGSDVCSLESRCGGTAVHERIRQGDVAGLCLLLDHCPQVADVPDTLGMTPLQLALSRTDGHMKQLAAFLLHYGADPACLMTPSFQVSNPNNSTARNTTSTAAGGQNSHATEADTIARFYRLQFLRSLLSSIIVTTASVSKLVDLGLLTEDLVQQILQEYEDAHMDDATEHGRNVADNFHAAAESGIRSSHRQCCADRTQFPQNISCGNFAGAPTQFQGRGSPAFALTVISPSNNNSSISNSTSNSNTAVQSPAVTRIYTSNSFESEAVACASAALRHSLTLKHHCRLTVRKILHKSLPAGLRHLGLPKSLQTYLNLGVDADRGDPFRVVQLHVAVVENDRAALIKLLEDGTHPDAPLRQCTPLTAALAMLPDADVFPDATTEVDVTAGNGVTGLVDVETTDDFSGLDHVADKDDITTQRSSEILARDGPLALDDISAGDDVTGKKVTKGDVTARRNVTMKANVTTSGTLEVLHEGFLAARDTTTQDDARKLKDDVITLILRHGASSTQRDPLGDTPLHAAVRRGAFFVHRLLTAVAHVNPVVHAATTGTLHSTCGCINKCINCTGGCICRGVKGYDGLKELIQCGLREKDRLGLTPLQLATLSGDVASARLMLRYWRSDGGGVVEGGATKGCRQTDQTQKSEVSDDSGITILHSASAAGAFGEVTHLLTYHGIPPDVKDKLGNTPLYFAVCNGLVSPDMQRAYCSQWGGVKWGHMLSCWPLPPNRQVGEKSRDMEAELACLQLKSDREFSYSRTIQVLLQHGADISTCNLVAKDLLSQVAENAPEQFDVSY